VSNEITYHSAADTGLTLYAMVENTTGQIWNGTAFEDPVSANWGDYDIPMTEQATSTGIFRADMPAAAAGTYSYIIRSQEGASPAVDDIVMGSSSFFAWDGSAIVSLGTLRSEPGQGTPAAIASLIEKIDYLYKNWRNRKVQSGLTPNTGTWELYADDEVTVDQKAAVSDDGTDAEKGEIVTGL
jgi:hypothetical protein